MKTWAVVPVKRLQDAKQRLSGLISPEQRRSLYLAMLTDVLLKLSEVASISGIYLISPEKYMDSFVNTLPVKVHVLPEEGKSSLNGAVRQAGKYFLKNGLDRMLVIPGDLPLLKPADLEELLQSARHAEVTVIPDKHMKGTNGLLMTPPEVFLACFGENSLREHVKRAKAYGVSCRVFFRESLSLDIDEPEDLKSILQYGEETRTFWEMKRLRLVCDAGVFTRAVSIG